jgi:hypothetical protein
MEVHSWIKVLLHVIEHQRLIGTKLDVPVLVDCLKWTSTFELMMVMKKLEIISYVT